MEHKKEQQSGQEASGPDSSVTRSARQMQEDNATGAKGNEQGRASFVPGSTTGGGSNFGQGSSHLGNESYRQGQELGPGSNYDNEAERLGSSTIGTSDEGATTPTGAGSADGPEQANVRLGATNEPDGSVPSARRVTGSGRPPSGSWSQSSTERT